MVLKYFTDGSCSGNPGPGGFSVVSNNKIILGNYEKTTNNEMELKAFSEAIKNSKSNLDMYSFKRVDIYSDSAYVVNSINQRWIYNWKDNNWMNRKEEPVKNVRLWKMVLEDIEILKKNKIKLNVIKIKGHSGVPENELCDKLAKIARDNKLEFEKEFTSRQEMFNIDSWLQSRK